MTALDRLAEGDEGAREELRLLREVVDCAQLVVMAQNGTNGMAITQALVREALDNLAFMPDPSPITIWREESQREKARADAAERERDTLAAEVKRLNEALRLSMPGASDAMLAALRAGEADGVEVGEKGAVV